MKVADEDRQPRKQKSESLAPPTGDEQYEVYAARFGTLETSKNRQFLNFNVYGEPDEPMTLDFFFWVIRNGNRTVVIDTGFDGTVGARRGRTVLSSVPDLLAQLDLPRNACVDVVLTHGHYDHIGNLDYFTRAQFYMSSAEFRFWTGPSSRHPSFAHLVEPEEIDALRRLDVQGRLSKVTGTTDLAPGIRLTELDGHTPGELVVSVRTPGGVILLASDAVHFVEELEQGRPFAHMTDLVAAHSSYETIREAVQSGEISRVIPGHDPRVLDGAGATSSPFIVSLSASPARTS